MKTGVLFFILFYFVVLVVIKIKSRNQDSEISKEAQRLGALRMEVAIISTHSDLEIDWDKVYDEYNSLKTKKY